MTLLFFCFVGQESINFIKKSTCEVKFSTFTKQIYIYYNVYSGTNTHGGGPAWTKWQT